MTLTVNSFDDLKTYRKDLAKTLRTTMKSKYSLVKYPVGDKVRELIVCGKDHDELLKALAEKQKKPLVAPGRDTYEAGTFHPVSGVALTGEHLKEFAVDDIATVYAKGYSDDEEIPEAGVTFGAFKRMLDEAKQLLPAATHPAIRRNLESWIQSAEQCLVQFDKNDYGSAVMTRSHLREAMDNQLLWVRLTKDLAHWLPIARQRTDGAAALLEQAQEQLDRGRVHEAERSYDEAKALFKSPKDLESSEKQSATDDPMARKLEEMVGAAAGPGDLYAKAKTAMIEAVKQNASNRQMHLHDEAKVLAKLLPALFKNDLKDKLEAVHKARGQRLDVRKPLIEKALIPLRSYLKGIDEIKQKADIDGSLMLMFRTTLERIQKDLLEDYRSKPLPGKD